MKVAAYRVNYQIMHLAERYDYFEKKSHIERRFANKCADFPTRQEAEAFQKRALMDRRCRNVSRIEEVSLEDIQDAHRRRLIGGSGRVEGGSDSDMVKSYPRRY